MIDSLKAEIYRSKYQTNIRNRLAARFNLYHGGLASVAGVKCHSPSQDRIAAFVVLLVWFGASSGPESRSGQAAIRSRSLPDEM